MGSQETWNQWPSIEPPEGQEKAPAAPDPAAPGSPDPAASDPVAAWLGTGEAPAPAPSAPAPPAPVPPASGTPYSPYAPLYSTPAPAPAPPPATASPTPAASSLGDWDLDFGDLDPTPAAPPAPLIASAPSPAAEQVPASATIPPAYGGGSPLAPAAPPAAPVPTTAPPAAPPLETRRVGIGVAQLVLEVTVGQRTTQVPLFDGETLLGRADPARGIHPGVDLTQDDAVSRRHARITGRGGLFTLSDLGSTNGTKLNDSWLQPHREQPLQAGDRIELGALTTIAVVEAPGGHA